MEAAGHANLYQGHCLNLVTSLIGARWPTLPVLGKCGELKKVFPTGTPAVRLEGC